MAQSVYEASLFNIRANANVSTARNVINELSDQKSMESVLTY